MSNGESPAFVVPKERGLDRNEKNGLTKREYFAAMAMQGMLAGFPNYIPEASEIIPYSVKFADELLKALES